MPPATPPVNRRTLTQYLIEQRRRFPAASGELNALILDVSIACKAIARSVAFGALGDPGAHLDLLDGGACGVPRVYPRGKYLLVFDPQGGSIDIDLNVSVGSIFSILRRPGHGAAGAEATAEVVEADFLQPGSRQVAAGYAIYGPTTMFVLSVGDGVVGFTLDPNLGEFKLTHPDIRVPEDTHEFAINSGNSRFWEPPVKRYVDECLAGKAGPRGKDFGMRWIASMVAEAHRILLRGGIFMVPRDSRDSRDAGQPGRSLLLYEANPIGFLVEQAGGRASTGRRPVLDVTPAASQQRVGLIFGSRSEVERIERYHREPSTRDSGNPLFTERSLFRD